MNTVRSENLYHTSEHSRSKRQSLLNQTDISHDSEFCKWRTFYKARLPSLEAMLFHPKNEWPKTYSWCLNMGGNIWNLSVYCAFIFFNEVTSSV